MEEEVSFGVFEFRSLSVSGLKDVMGRLLTTTPGIFFRFYGKGVVVCFKIMIFIMICIFSMNISPLTN